MIAIDAGFLYALADRRDAWHERAVAHWPTHEEGWITTWPVLAEACHLLGRRLGIDYVSNLLDDVAEGSFSIWSPPLEQLAHLPVLMRKYAKLPMDLADATLVLLAEHLGHGRILSTDERDFGTYRWKQRKPFHNLLAD
ncbi:PIN domain-containing protein [Aquincola sp. S2]|uniref:PIN domain-containing protein n=1 Tax=Pseudaquabacterium terrae TaxID=2732868 RepID=A0ABX2ELS5_9BURK|nr:PIN domain-containing protein [Aquabacterium terrae]NRF69520.1 PIN domain-containing protein [Aquabacterium terrae]